ncbi:hypothetical protein [uncultured virus]|uniref:Uncharacterized protein n=1 Tax=uncultured virus TaxID=340016 RepID=A0A218MLH4_9VIRU|nr:hypothetical protein [uncultured virus]
MKIIKNDTYISTPDKLRKAIQHFSVEDKIQAQDLDPYNSIEGEVTAIKTTGTCSQQYSINNKLFVENDVEFYVNREGSWSWKTTESLLVGDYLLTDHSKLERIDQLSHLDTVLEGCILTSDSNFYAGGYLVK